MLPLFDHSASKKTQSFKHHKQPEAYITNDQYEEPLEKRKAMYSTG